MNSRQRKKYEYVMKECAHNKTCIEQEPYGDYYVPREVFKCARQPQFSEHFSDESQDCPSDICRTCKSFTLSRKTMKLARERRDCDRYMNRNYYKIKSNDQSNSNGNAFKIFE